MPLKYYLVGVLMKIIVPISILAFIAGISLSLLYMGKSSSGSHSASQLHLPGGGDFTLHEGDKPVRLSDFKGKAVLLFFGYTSCPDVCPTSLAFMSSSLKSLSEAEQEKVQVLFISVDPERDTPEKLQEYTHYFHSKIKGITGSKTEIDGVVKQYGAAYQKVASESAMGYLVDHSSSVFVINPQGQFVDMLPHGLPVEEITKTIKKLI